MDKTVVILLVILILVIVVFGMMSLRSSTNTNQVSGAAVAPKSFPSQYSGGGCGR